MASTVKILLYGQLKSVLKLESYTSLKELEHKAASVFKMPKQFDVDFEEWVVLDEDYVLQNKDQLQVIVVDESRSIFQVLFIIVSVQGDHEYSGHTCSNILLT